MNVYLLLKISIGQIFFKKVGIIHYFSNTRKIIGKIIRSKL